MKKRDLSRLNMFETVQLLFSQNQTVVDSLPAFKAGADRFSAAVARLKSSAEKEKQTLTGIATDKAALRDDLTDRLATLCAAVSSFATESGNSALLEEMDYPESRLARLAGANFLLVARHLLAVTSENVRTLADFGVTPAQLTDLTATIDAYEAAKPAPRNAIALRRNATEAALTSLDEADAILRDSLDKLARQFQHTQPAFYSAYLTSRTLIDPYTSVTRLIVEVSAGASDTPVANAEVLVNGTDIVVTTDAGGTCLIRGIEAGTRSITIRHKDFTGKTVDGIRLKLGKATRLKAALDVAQEA